MIKKDTINQTNNLSLTISALAFIISAGSLYFSYYTYTQSNKENISVIATPVTYNYVTHVEPTIGILTTQWVIVISNNGDKTSSIVQYRLFQLNKDNNRAWYSDMDQGIFDENGQRISLPIDIESGKSRKIILKLGIWLNTEAEEVLKSTHFKKGNVAIQTIRDTLYKHSI